MEERILRGKLIPGASLQGQLRQGATLRGAVLAGARFGGALPDYEGPYEVVPKVAAQALPTAERALHKDLHITGVPIYETSNDAGGTTVYIAHEAEMEVL